MLRLIFLWLLVTSTWNHLLAQEKQTSVSSTLELQGVESPTKTDFHGFTEWDFELADEKARCRIVEPLIAAEGKPWIWRARFFGHQPALDIQLLQRGFHVAYCDVSNLYGSPKAVDRWDQFYDLMQSLGFHSKPVLEGMSRGGLIIFHWAKQNPSKVSAIYADNPVCDIHSWPKGKSDPDWERCKKAWGLATDNPATDNPATDNPATDNPATDNPATDNPATGPHLFDGLESLAKSSVPIYLVVGEKDTVVPPQENADRLKNAYIESGGFIKEWRKPDAGHHPHGLHPPDELVQDLLQSTLPKPQQATAQRRKTLQSSKRVLFLGDSITFAGDYVIDFETWARQEGLAHGQWINAGLPSETVSGLSENGHAGGRFPRPHLHERLKRVLDAVKPELVVACYGMNCGIYLPLDRTRMRPYQEGIVRLKQEVESRGASIIFVTPMPYDSPQPHHYGSVLQFYSYWLLSKRDKGWNVIDLNFEMTKRIFQIRREDPTFTFQKDRVHPNKEGHRVAAQILADYFSAEDHNLFGSEAFQEQRPSIAIRSRKQRNEYLELTGHMRPGTPGFRKSQQAGR